jgi:TPP-dependent 2-oxoacid decarboxylase
MAREWTVGRYLARRMEQVGVKQIFGVPGDYVMGFLEEVVAADLEWIGTCNELNAGYAADAYGRVNGIAAVVVTYDVGGLSLLNAVAGSHAERVPVIVVSGAPPTIEIKHPHVLHHTTGDLNAQLNAYHAVTETAVQLSDAGRAPDLIDGALATCLRLQRPVYLELPMDVVGAPCRAPGEFRPDIALTSDPEVLDEAVQEAAAMVSAAASGVVMAGIEARRLRCDVQMQALIEHLDAPFVTTCLSKTVLSERHPLFAGVYAGRMGQEWARAVVEEADVVLSLGNLMTDFDLGFYTAQLDPSKLIVANSDRVRVKHHVYDQVDLRSFIDGLQRALPAGQFGASGGNGKGSRHRIRAASQPAVRDDASPLRLAEFYARVGDLIGPHSIVVADIGAASLGAADLLMPEDSLYLSQAFYMSVGWGVPATLGAGVASPGSRVFAFVGDGALQFTAQELSTIVRLGQNPVVFVLDNDGYTVERVIHEGPFNDIRQWRYDRLFEVFGGPPGLRVATPGELERAVEHIRTHTAEPLIVDVAIARMDIAEGMKGLVAIGGRSTPGA